MFNGGGNNMNKERFPVWNFEFPEFTPHDISIEPGFKYFFAH